MTPTTANLEANSPPWPISLPRQPQLRPSPGPRPLGLERHVGVRRGARPSGHQRTTTLTLCLFHLQFGYSAKQCTPACSRWNKRNRSRDAAGQHVSATNTSSRPPPPSQPVQLGLILDDNSRTWWLLDMGSQVSLWPPSPSSSKLSLSHVQLTAANGTLIRAFGHQTKQIKISGKQYSFVFIIAQVSRPILGLDFLQQFNMTIDMSKRQLIHSGVSTRFSSASSDISSINVVHAPHRSLACFKTFRRSLTPC